MPGNAVALDVGNASPLGLDSSPSGSAGAIRCITLYLSQPLAKFPCRAIVVLGSDSSDRHIHAEVSALCHLPAPGLPQVCSERIVLRAGTKALDLVPGAIRPLLEADLPMVLWWTGDPRKQESLFRDLGDECARLILDLPDPGAEAGALRLGLDRALCPSSRDSAWFGLARWRELVAQFFDPPCSLQSLKQIASIRIEALSPDPRRPPRAAIWLAAWFAGQLEWKPVGRPALHVNDIASSLQSTFASDAGHVTVEITTRGFGAATLASPCLSSIELRTNSGQGAEVFRVSRPTPGSPAVRVEAEASDSCILPRVIDAPELDPARRIAAALESSRLDRPFDKALPFAIWMMEPGVV